MLSMWDVKESISRFVQVIFSSLSQILVLDLLKSFILKLPNTLTASLILRWCAITNWIWLFLSILSILLGLYNHICNYFICIIEHSHHVMNAEFPKLFIYLFMYVWYFSFIYWIILFCNQFLFAFSIGMSQN